MKIWYNISVKQRQDVLQATFQPIFILEEKTMQENIEKLLKAFPKGLHVRHDPVSKEDDSTSKKSEPFYTCATDEAKEALGEALKEHLEKELSRCHIGLKVTYNYYLGTVRNSSSSESRGAAVVSINSKLQEVMDELPKLSEGESYVFPAQTSVSVKVLGFDNDEIVTILENVSPWILELMK